MRSTFTKLFLAILYLIITSVLLFTCSQIQSDTSTLVVLLIITLLSLICVICTWDNQIMARYKHKKRIVAIVVTSLYASFASFGYRLFLNYSRIRFEFSSIFIFLCGVIWFIPIIFTILFIIEKASSGVKRKNVDTKSRKKAYMILLAILSAAQCLILLSFWPGGFPNDTVWQFAQVTGSGRLNDWHPVLYTLMMRTLWNVIPNAGFITVVQMFSFALLCVSVLMIGYDYGIPLYALCITGVIFILLPNQVMSSIGIVKDFPFTLALLWSTLLLVKLIRNESVCQKVHYILSLSLAMFLVFGLRHNGIVPYIFMIILCIYLAAKRFRQRWGLLLSTVISIILVLVYKGPLMKLLDPIPNDVSPYVTMLCAVGACVNQDCDLSQETDDVIERIMPLDDWKNYYSRFQGHNLYLWGRGADKTMDTSFLTAKEAFSIYFDALFKYPDVVIKDRLDGCNILWDVTQPAESFNARYFDYIQNIPITNEFFDISQMPTDRDGNYVNTSFLAEEYRALSQITSNGLLDIFIWRSGSYLILFFVMLIFVSAHRINKLWYSFIPLIGNTLGSLLVVFHQSFRYVYFVQQLVLVILFAVILLKNELEEEPSL